MVIAVHRLSHALWHPSLSALIDQLRRAGLSVQLNIAEGHALGGNRQFARHLTIAYGSAIELVDLLDLLRELAPASDAQIEPLAQRARQNCALVLALKRSVFRKASAQSRDG
jgi:four helix bundle protein